MAINERLASVVCVVSLGKDPVTPQGTPPFRGVPALGHGVLPESTELSPSFLMQCVHRGGRPTDPGPQRGGDRRHFPVPLEGRGGQYLAALQPL